MGGLCFELLKNAKRNYFLTFYWTFTRLARLVLLRDVRFWNYSNDGESQPSERNLPLCLFTTINPTWNCYGQNPGFPRDGSCFNRLKMVRLFTTSFSQQLSSYHTVNCHCYCDRVM
jgi:hypothetical protein